MRSLLYLIAGLFGASAAAQWSPVSGQLETRWAAQVRPGSVHTEYPRPQLVRDQWISLNGLWDYAIRPLAAGPPEDFEGKIFVPFAVESALSGVKRQVGAEKRLWYRRHFQLLDTEFERAWLLHFGAVDWHARVWVDGAFVGEHRGGYDPFSFAIDGVLHEGAEHELVVSVWDPTDDGTQPRGKQVEDPHGIWYTPVTGIWQTVWLEPVPRVHIRSLSPVADLDEQQMLVDVELSDLASDLQLMVRVRAGDKQLAEVTGPAGERVTLTFDDPIHPWSPNDPFLHDIEVELRAAGGEVLDCVESVFGMRTIDVRKGSGGHPRLFLNGEELFQFGPLDQGWWPDGLYTAPSDAALASDLELLKRLGFNMVRKHVKVEPARWYHHCDLLGLLVWQDMPNGDRQPAWDAHGSHDGTEIERTPESAQQFERELRGIVDALRPFASVVMWVPFNEAWGQFETERISRWLTKHDPTRVVNCASGGNDFPVGDVRDIHRYPGPVLPPPDTERARVLGEFGGLGLPIVSHTWAEKEGWGYRNFESQADLQEAYLDLIGELRWLIGEGLSAAVYTQITDVETEVNGLLSYDRAVLKVDVQKVAKAHATLYRPPPQVVTVVPTSEVEGRAWRYTTKKPASEWFAVDFDDGSWLEGQGGFGKQGTPGAMVRTDWHTSEIWLRREFQHRGDVPKDLHLRVHHDEDVVVWLNGRLVAERKGYTTGYAIVPMREGVTLQQGSNVLAVHCRQTGGGQYIDIGVVDVVEAP
jgi:hypothetical protein